MKVELERNRRQRTVAFPANLSALRLRPWEAATVALDRLTPFPARVTAWSLAAEGGVDLTLEEEDAAVWDWNPAVDERATPPRRRIASTRWRGPTPTRSA